MHRSEDWEVSAALRGARASSSSKNSTQGAAARARLNSCLTARSLSPTHLFSSSGPCTPMHLLDDVGLSWAGGPRCMWVWWGVQVRVVVTSISSIVPDCISQH